MSKDSEVGRRLHAARLAAGFITAVSAAGRIGKSRTYYGRLENGHVNVPKDLVLSAAHVFGVSESYLDNGKAETPKESLASRIEGILAQYSNEDVNEDAVLRLRVMRAELGISTARAGAKAAGAKPATYMAHENGSRALPVDRMIGYALALGVRPEFAVLGSGRAQAEGVDVVNFWTRRDDEPLPNRHQLDWPWLNNGHSPARSVLPLVEAQKGRFQLLDGGGITVPMSLLPLRNEEQHYGFVVRGEKATKVYVINPRPTGQEILVATANGDLGHGRPGNFPPRDIFAGQRNNDGSEAVGLGQVVATISVDW